MVLDPRKRQKKLERRKAKEKARNVAQASRDPTDFRIVVRRPSLPPILHCFVDEAIWDEGMGNLVISREFGGRVLYAIFLLDTYCLGVKNVATGVALRNEYDWRVHAKMTERGITPLKPECARKLIEGAVEYARSFNLPPHEDYRHGGLILADIDAQACTREFQYGKDGKPCFISGPHDSPARCMKIMERLRETCAPRGIEPDFVIYLGSDQSESHVRSNP